MDLRNFLLNKVVGKLYLLENELFIYIITYWKQAHWLKNQQLNTFYFLQCIPRNRLIEEQIIVWVYDASVHQYDNNRKITT